MSNSNNQLSFGDIKGDLEDYIKSLETLDNMKSSLGLLRFMHLVGAESPSLWVTRVENKEQCPPAKTFRKLRINKK